MHSPLSRTRNPETPSLIKALFLSFSPTLLASIPPAIIRSLTQVVQPVLVNATLIFMNSYSDPAPGQSSEPDQWGWSLVGAFAIVFIGLAASTSQYFYYVYRSGAFIRGAMVEAIYRKTLKMAGDRIDDTAEGEEGDEPANALNLMRYVDPLTRSLFRTDDVTLVLTSRGLHSLSIPYIVRDRLQPFILVFLAVIAVNSHLYPFSEIWSSLIVIAIGLYVLYTQLGASFVASVIVTAIVMILTPILSRRIDDLQSAWSSVTDKRVGLLSGIFHQIKGVKFGAYESDLVQKVEKVRSEELSGMKKFWGDFAVVVCVTNTALNMLSLFTLGYVSLHQTAARFCSERFPFPRAYAIVAHLSGHGSLDTTRLFTSYTVISIIAAPLFSVGQNYGTVMAAYSSLKRIENYLLAPETSLLQPSHPKPSSKVTPSPTSLNEGEKMGLSAAPSISASLSSTEKKGREEREKSPYTEDNAEIGEGKLVVLKDVKLGWGEKVVLSDINVDISRGTVTMVVGRVGCVSHLCYICSVGLHSRVIFYHTGEVVSLEYSPRRIYPPFRELIPRSRTPLFLLCVLLFTNAVASNEFHHSTKCHVLQADGPRLV